MNTPFPNYHYNSHHAFLGKKYSMGAKERCAIVSIQFTAPPFPDPELVKHTLNRGDLIVSYKSFYNESFQFSTEEEKA